MTMLSPESDAAKVPAAIDSRRASTRTSETFDERRRDDVRLRASACLWSNTQRRSVRGAARRTAFGDDARARDDACFFLIAGERVYLLVSARSGDGDAPVVRAIPNPDVEVPSRWTWLPEPKTDETRAGRSSSPSVWRLFVAGGAGKRPDRDRRHRRLGAIGAFDEQSTAPDRGTSDRRARVTAILPAPLSNAPRGWSSSVATDPRRQCGRARATSPT